jgi:S-adenosylmethionine:tRNA-ribosyltransferase-isomerase (queuine synthetase)
MHCALAAMHIGTRSVRALETRMHEAARALQVGATAIFLIAALLIARWYR